MPEVKLVMATPANTGDDDGELVGEAVGDTDGDADRDGVWEGHTVGKATTLTGEELLAPAPSPSAPNPP